MLQVVYCVSEAIDTVLAFGVQNYLEFKLFQGRCSAQLPSALALLVACTYMCPPWHATLETETNQCKIPSVPAHLWQKAQRASEGQLSGMFVEAVFDNSACPCSYLYTGGKLTSVPASRAAVFKDRSLRPLDKRLLTRFLMQLGSSMHGNPFPQVHQAAAQLQYELLIRTT